MQGTSSLRSQEEPTARRGQQKSTARQRPFMHRRQPTVRSAVASSGDCSAATLRKTIIARALHGLSAWRLSANVSELIHPSRSMAMFLPTPRCRLSPFTLRTAAVCVSAVSSSSIDRQNCVELWPNCAINSHSNPLSQPLVFFLHARQPERFELLPGSIISYSFWLPGRTDSTGVLRTASRIA